MDLERTIVASHEGAPSAGLGLLAAHRHRVDLGLDSDGHLQQKQVGGFRTKKDAQAALNEALAGLQHNTFVAPSRQTVAAFLELWIDGARSELAITVWTNYGEIIRRYVVPHLGSKRLVDLSPLDVKAWHAALLERGRIDGGALSVASVQLAHRVLHRALADAVRWKLISANPASGARVPRGERKEMRVWTTEEAGTFLGSVADDRLAAAVGPRPAHRGAARRASCVPGRCGHRPASPDRVQHAAGSDRRRRSAPPGYAPFQVSLRGACGAPDRSADGAVIHRL